MFPVAAVMRCLRPGDLKQQNLCSLLWRPEIQNRVPTGLVFLKPLQKAPSFPTASSGSGLPRLPAASLQCLLRPHKACPALCVCVHLALFLLEASVSGFRTCVLSDSSELTYTCTYLHKRSGTHVPGLGPGHVLAWCRAQPAAGGSGVGVG